MAHRAAGIVLVGSVSERPKEHASKACEGATPPWVQIPPLPPPTCGDAVLSAGAARYPSALVSVLVSFRLDVGGADLPDQAVDPVAMSC